MGPPTGWYRLRLLRQILDELVPGVEQFLLVDNVVAVEDGPALVQYPRDTPNAASMPMSTAPASVSRRQYASSADSVHAASVVASRIWYRVRSAT